MIEPNVLRLAKSMFEYLLEHQSSKKSEIMDTLNVTEREFDKIRGLLRRKKLVIKRWTEEENGENLTAVYEVPRNLMDFKRLSPERFSELLE